MSEVTEVELPGFVSKPAGLTNEDYIKASKMCHPLFTSEETLEKAWAVYSHRERYYFGPLGRSGLNTPVWRGEDLNGKTLVLCYEQALGEMVMFSSMLPDLLAMGAKLIVEVDKRLVPLLQRSFSTVEFVPWQHPWHRAVYRGDYYTLLGSVGYYLRKNRAAFGQPKAYLQAEPLELPTKLPKVGLSWFSPMKYLECEKSISYFDLAPLTENHEKSLFCVNLQYGKAAPLNIHTVPGVDLTKDIDTIASIISSLDCVVTISNTVAHLSGALGKKTYLLLQKEPAKLWYWCWPWYKDVHIVEVGPNSTWEDKIREIYERITQN